MTKAIETCNDLIWGAPALVLILGVGIYLSVRLGFVQLTFLPAALKDFFSKLLPQKDTQGSVSPFQALCTALSATVGTGNLVGVAGAICLGGPGAVFWMWICGVFGMITKYAEAVLAVRYRVKSGDSYMGGPMYMISQGLGKRWQPMARVYCLFGVIAAFGVGNAAQINAVISGIHSVMSQFGVTQSKSGDLLIGSILALLIGTLLLGGAQAIGRATERLVPVAAAGYILLCLGVLTVKAEAIPEAIHKILLGALSPKAVTGGMLGSAFQALRVGCSRGVFTNEAGMGTASIAHASAEVSHPVQQGLMGIMEVFLDTILICTLTAMVILVSGVPIPYGTDLGGRLTNDAFATVYGKHSATLIAAAMVLFAVATVLGWSLYGGRCAEYLMGEKSWKYFVAAQIVTVVAASVADTGSIWQLSEMVNGLMVIPNLVTLAALTPELVRLTKEYRESGRGTAGGGNYADFHQCKPL